MMRFLIFLAFFFHACILSATHNRGGYITYEHISGKTYKITVTTCTKKSAPADRPELQICWGDGSRDTLLRTSFIDNTLLDVRQNYYTGIHTYAANGEFLLEVYDPNRNAGVLNITDAVNQPFCITTKLIISPFMGSNNSAQFDYCPCPEYACTFQPYCYNPGAYDPDGDSLSFELVPCRGSKDCLGDRLTCCYEPCPFMAVGVVYFYLGSTPGLGGPAVLDPVSGNLCWTSPTVSGEYNIAILVHEWRKVGPGMYYEVGNVTLDYQITVSGNCENNAPSLTQIDDTCIVAGSTLDLTINATDPDPLDDLTMNAGGQPFEFDPDSASFTVPGNGTTNSLTGSFHWETNCSHVSNTPYLITVSVKDNDAGNTGGSQIIPLADYESFLIRVIPPPVTGVTANNVGNTIEIDWIPQTSCGGTGYKIYRSNSPIANTESCCDGSTAEDLGYTLVGTVNGITNSHFVDNNSLSVGQNYCYVVVLYYADGSTSCPSDPVCDQLLAEFPIMTRVSIDVTDAVLGTDTVEWYYPYELDTLSPPYNTGNFYYEVYRSTGTATPVTLIHTTVISSSLSAVQRVYADDSLNTRDLRYTYKVKLYHVSTTGTTTYIGESTPATSIYLNLTPNDNRIDLSWLVNQPWINSLYEVWRETPTGSGVFTLLDTTSQTTYTDDSLLNGADYCYRIKAIGNYTAPEIPSPLINWSQEACASPVDLTAPCPPVLSIEGDCEEEMNTLVWTDPNNSCADDVMSYNIYYSATDTGSFNLLAQVTVSTDTIYLHSNNGSIAGCYYVTALDSIQYSNESAASNMVCIDNCPYYWLPNVFTPNGDGHNDMFIPFPYKYIQDVDFKVFDRWGKLVFQTTDRDIKWDGTYQGEGKTKGQALTDGVYYYTCLVNTIRLKGIDPVELHGFVHIFTQSDGQQK